MYFIVLGKGSYLADLKTRFPPVGPVKVTVFVSIPFKGPLTKLAAASFTETNSPAQKKCSLPAH